MTKNVTETGKQSFGIGAVARLTGLTDHTIRVWERRYDAIVAGRAPNGRRVYKAADIEKLKLLKLLTDHGLSIGRIAGETMAELTARANELRELSAPAQPVQQIRVAILGELLPTLISAEKSDLGRIRLVASDSQEARFLADLEQQAVDVLVVELPVLSDDTWSRLSGLKSATGAARVVCIYSFSKAADADSLRDRGVILLRAPITVDEAVQAVIRAADATDGSARIAQFPEINTPDDELLDDGGPIEPRLFSQQQLSALANRSGTIECECPQHLAQLVGALSAFEIYSATCANRNEDDAALHRSLHRTTARARSLIERALQRVARAEGLL